MVAFSSETGRKRLIKSGSRTSRQGDPIQLTFGDVRAIRPTWSPQGDQIVFARPGQGLWSIPPLGGQPRQLMDAGRRPRFSADGRRLVFLRGDEIWIANADGSQPRRVLTARICRFCGAIPKRPVDRLLPNPRRAGGRLVDGCCVGRNAAPTDVRRGRWRPPGVDARRSNDRVPFSTRGQRDALADTCGWGLALTAHLRRRE